MNALYSALNGLRKEELPFLGFLFFGLIEVDGEPYVIEYTYMTQKRSRSYRGLKAIFCLLWNLANGKMPAALGERSILPVIRPLLPRILQKRRPYLTERSWVQCAAVHAGTAHDGSGKLVTNGGRVLAVNALGGRLSDCLESIYDAIGDIEFDGMQYRRDIGSGL